MKKNAFIEWGLFALTLIFFSTAVICCNHFHFFNLVPGGSIKANTESAANISMELTGMVVCSFLYASLLLNSRHTLFRKLFMQLLFFENLTLFCDSITWIIAGKPEYNTLLIIANLIFYICLGMIFLLFWGTEIEIMNLSHSIPKSILYGIRVMAILYFACNICNLKFGFCYYIKDTMYYNGKFYLLEYAFPFILCCVLFYHAVRAKTILKIKLSYVLTAALPILIIVLQTFAYSLSLLTMSILTVILVLYINIHVNLGLEIEEFRNKVMISQIQPHFMYNTLTTIKALCRVNPNLAANTITNFADYLRGNMDFASLESTIPFEKELKHTRIYTEIEALRFDNINFEFKIEDENFQVPALVVQPMVENAVRHGVRSRKDGHILVHTFADEKYHNIVIQDNGKGFDKTQFNGSRTHIGLENTRLRIERLVHGIFTVESKPEEGVTITMKIPK